MEGQNSLVRLGNGSENAELGLGRHRLYTAMDYALRAGLCLSLFLLKWLLSFLPLGRDNKNRKD